MLFNFGLYEVLATSPVGAGDSYSAGIVYGMSQNCSYIDCAKFASELAAISVESHTSYPDNDEYDMYPIFSECKNNIIDSDLILAFVDGADVDSGVAWELGYVC